MIFDNQRDASNRLTDTIVMYRGKAAYVRGVDDKLRIHGKLILDEEEVRFKQDDPDYCSYCPSLGYINTENNALYFMRQPMRRWKQGIDSRAIVCPQAGPRARAGIGHREIAMCLERKYPRLDETLGLFNNLNPFKETRRLAVAFSPHFAVGEGGREGRVLLYKGREVGVVEQGRPLLSADFFWLNELMESEL